MYQFETMEGQERFSCLLEGLAASLREGTLEEVIVVTGDGTVSVFMDGKRQLDALRLMNDAQGAMMDLFEHENEEEDE